MDTKIWSSLYSFLKGILSSYHKERAFGYFFSKGLHILFRTPFLRKPFLELTPSEPREIGPIAYGIVLLPPLPHNKDIPEGIWRFITENRYEDFVFLTEITYTPTANQDLFLFANTFLENTHLSPSLPQHIKRYRILGVQNKYGDGIIIVKEALFWSKTLFCLMPTSLYSRKRHYLLAVNAQLPIQVKEDISSILKNMLESPEELPRYAVSFAEIHL